METPAILDELAVNDDDTLLARPSDVNGLGGEDCGAVCHSQQDSTSPDRIGASTPQHQQLEERVLELEQKLATLSLLLSHQRRNGNAISPPSITPLPSPGRNEDASRYLALDSPDYHRSNDGHRRNLSYRVLHCPDFPRRDDDKESSHLGDNLFLPVRLPGLTEIDSVAQRSECVSPSREAKDGNRRDAEDVASLDTTSHSIGSAVEHDKVMQSLSGKANLENSGPKSPMEKADNVKSKWLDYLNSFQESNYDTDKQMEEFVKIPSAVEALLSFGFWICVDSFLYILTILPIRFVWSSLLLARFLTMRFLRFEVPDGPFRFHRR